jgi:adenylosuccinate lyase
MIGRMASPLDALSPLDGRYAAQTAALAACFSERALIRRRVTVECAFLLALLDAIGHPAARDGAAVAAVRALAAGFGPADAEAVKALEATTRHDVKAVEYWLKERVRAIPALAADAELVHLGLTSEDVNNLAWGLMHREALDTVLLPAIADVLEGLVALARDHRATPMLARTHGQPASPTTFGKEMGVFAARLARTAADLAALEPPGKLSGATGTYAALALAYPDVDWIAFARRFVAGLGLRPVVATTQVEPRDGLAAIYDAARRVANVLLDLAPDMWRYVSDGWLRQAAKAGEVGSSAMPHKVNPIDFENAEGNGGLAVALLGHLADALVVSRLQRDLSDSTTLRNAGVALGHLLLACRSTARGLGRVAPDAGRMAAALDAHPEVLAEAIQVVGRAEGAHEPYERLKALTRGQEVDLAALRAAGAAIAPGRAALWAGLTPAGYVGLAPRVADEAVAEATAVLTRLRAGG